ncbi:hypothetical protein ACFU8I_10060 [Streptomyces sp. NPDC057540]|uniref:hypothetical protein n=1 Tax=Streptomyces sp. NPDC057540 TaxID=3346160 RepID=UPI0036BA211F
MGARRVAAAACALFLGAGAVAWWQLGDPAPYALRESPAVTVTVRAAASDHPDAAEVAEETDLLIRASVQRLAAGDAAGLADLGAPWFTGRREAAEALVAEYRDVADQPVAATVADPVVPHLASVDLRFTGGERQRLYLSRADGVWWLELGEGDPVAP